MPVRGSAQQFGATKRRTTLLRRTSDRPDRPDRPSRPAAPPSRDRRSSEL